MKGDRTSAKRRTVEKECDQGSRWEVSQYREATLRMVLYINSAAAGSLIAGSTLALALGLTHRTIAAIAIGAVSTVLALAAVAGSVALHEVRRRHYLSLFLRKTATKHLRAAIRKDTRSSGALPELILFNRTEMERFECIAQTQARSSYRAGLSAAAVGLVVLVAAIVFALAAPDIDEKAAAGTIGVLSGAVSAYISRAFLATYRMAAQQMSFYYGQPLVNCFLLHAELLTNAFDGADREAARKEVLSAVLMAAGRAQHQILILANGEATPEPAPLGDSAIANGFSVNGRPFAASKAPSSPGGVPAARPSSSKRGRA